MTKEKSGKDRSEKREGQKGKAGRAKEKSGKGSSYHPKGSAKKPVDRKGCFPGASMHAKYR
jgi:hypothetical protein